MPIVSAITSIIGGVQGASAAHDASTAAQAGYNTAGQTVQTSAANANAGVGSAAERAASGVSTAAGNSNLMLSQLFGNVSAANQPYQAAGQGAANTLASSLAPGGDLTQKFTGVDMSNDPGYQFRLDQGQQALERSAAARGGVLGGGAAKAETQFAQGFASNEYQNAFNRFTQQQQQKYGMLAGAAQIGQTANNNQTQASENFGGQISNNTVGAAQYGGNAFQYAAGEQSRNTMAAGTYQGNTQIGAGNAKAAGDIGAANAWNGMLSGLGTAAGGFSNPFSLKNPFGGGGGGQPIAAPGGGFYDV
jgi:hypothetical protein